MMRFATLTLLVGSLAAPGLAGRDEPAHGLREHGEPASRVGDTEKTGAFLPTPWLPRHAAPCLAARVAFHHGLPAQTRGSFKARLSPVPIDLAMQATIAGRGSVSARLDGSRLTISGTFEGLLSPATVARVHRGYRGVRGPAFADLKVTNSKRGTMTGSIELTPSQINDLAKSLFYVQLHSERAPDGNLWGWLLPVEGKTK